MHEEAGNLPSAPVWDVGACSHQESPPVDPSGPEHNTSFSFGAVPFVLLFWVWGWGVCKAGLMIGQNRLGGRGNTGGACNYKHI